MPARVNVRFRLNFDPDCGRDSALSAGAPLYAFTLLVSGIFLLPLLLQSLPWVRLDIEDILLCSALPGVCAYALFVPGMLPFRMIDEGDWRLCWLMLILLLAAVGLSGVIWRKILTVCGIDFTAEQMIFTVVKEASRLKLIKLFFALCIFAPLTEELLFRRIIYGFFLRFGVTAGVFVTQLLFAFCHFFIAGIPGLFILGCGFQYVYLKRRNLGAAVLLHGMVNTAAFAAALTERWQLL